MLAFGGLAMVVIDATFLLPKGAGEAMRWSMVIMQTLLLVVIVVVWNLMMVVLAIRRLHDCNYSGGLMLFIFVPLLNGVFALALMLIPGTKGENQFGAPRASTGVERVCGLLMALGSVFYLWLYVAGEVGWI